MVVGLVITHPGALIPMESPPARRREAALTVAARFDVRLGRRVS